MENHVEHDVSGSLKGKKIVVFGAAGAIGGAVVTALDAAGTIVYPVVRARTRFTMSLHEAAPHLANRHIDHADVQNEEQIRELARVFRTQVGLLDGIVYSVGRCPREGFAEAASTPLSDLSTDVFRDELEMHCIGFLIVFKYFSRQLADGGSLIGIGSAITRLTKETRPEWLYADHYIAAKEAQAKLLLGMRNDPVTKKKHLLMHFLEFKSVDTPFHEGASHGLPLVPLEQATSEILAALASPVTVTKVVRAEPLLPPSYMKTGS